MPKRTQITKLKRPRILVKAAQISAQSYDRNKVLRRVLSCVNLPLHANAIDRLQEHEVTLNEARLSGKTSYKVQHHITVLSALLGEMHLLGKQFDQPNASGSLSLRV
jgi:hypothetical protein